MLVRQLAQQERPYHYRVLAFDPLNNHSYSGEIIQLSKHLEVVICPLREKRFGLPLPGLLSVAPHPRATERLSARFGSLSSQQLDDGTWAENS